MRSPFVDFSVALQSVKVGILMQRAGWHGKQAVGLTKPDRDSFLNSHYLYQTTADGYRMPWVATQGDLLAEDWHSIE